jgi:hypothetical protein
MKKTNKTLLLGLFIGLTIATTTSTFADSALEKIEAYLNPSLTITMDGTLLSFENPKVTYDGTTYLSLRDTAKILGKDVKWNEETQTIELNGSISNTGSNVQNKDVNNVNDKGVSNMSEQEVVFDYYNESEGKAILNGITYLSIPIGIDKYNIRKFYNSNGHTNGLTVYFSNTNINIEVPYPEISYDSNGFFYKGSTYMKESIYQQAKEQIEKAK